MSTPSTSLGSLDAPRERSPEEIERAEAIAKALANLDIILDKMKVLSAEGRLARQRTNESVVRFNATARG